MRTRSRGWRITMWASLAVAVAVAMSALGTRGDWGAMWSAQGGTYVVVEHGCFYCGEGYFNGFARPEPAWFSFDRYNAGLRRRWTLTVSLWLPAGAALSLAAFSAWRLRRAHFAPGLCPRCGYSRVGIDPDALCPECGRAAKG